MLKKIFSISILTGLSNIISFIAISVLSKNSNPRIVGIIGTVDSYLYLITAIINFGIQLAVSRTLVTSKDWKTELILIQKSRFSLSIFLLVIGIILFIVTNKIQFLIFLTAPLIALNLIYALYGYGKPLIASLYSFIYLGFPSLVIVLSIFYFNEYIVSIYIISFCISILLTGYLSSKIIGINYLQSIKKKFYKVYLSNFHLGIAGIGISLSLNSYLSILALFYDETSIGYSFVAIKLFILYKGFRRILIQSFLKDILNENKAKQIDYISIISCILFFVVTFFYPEELVNLFFNEKYLDSIYMFKFIGLAAMISSIITTYDTRILFEKKDIVYIKGWMISSSVSVIIAAILSYYIRIYGIFIGILIGELLRFIIFVKNTEENKTIIRLKFLLKNLWIFIIPISSNLFDLNIEPLIIISLITIVLVIQNRKLIIEII